MTLTSELTTIRDYIRYATSSFNQAGLVFGHGTDNAWDEAVSLVLHSLHLPHDISKTILNAKLTTNEKETIANLIKKRVDERIPLAYLTHEAWFCGLPFFVDERVLIPRSPIAELIEHHFEPWIDSTHIGSILDLCTGSGCIAIACAKAFPHAIIHASDFFEDALAVAKINALKHGVEDQVTFYHSNLFAQIPPMKYDIIVSNPPYVDIADMSTLPTEYTYEPAAGLAAGKEGLDFILPILKHAASFLKPQGILVVEVGNTEHILKENYQTIPFTWIEFERADGGVFLLAKENIPSDIVESTTRE